MKKIIYILLLITAVLPGLSSLADNPVELRIPDETATVGDFINIPVYVDNSVTGENVYSYQFQIYYYSSSLTFVSVETAGTLSESWGTPMTNISVTNYLSIAGAGATPLSGTGILFYMRFECISSGGSPLYFNSGDANNYFNEGTPGLTLDDGYISIAALPTINVYPDNGLLTVGSQMQFNVSGGTAPYSWFVTNSAVASINSSGLLSANAHGLTKVVAEDDNGIRDTITGLIEIRAMQVSFHDTTAWQGSTIDIPIYTTNLSGLDIMSGNISFSFNQNILTPTTLITTGTLLDGYSVSFNNSNAGNVNIAFAGTSPVSGDGVLLYIRFDVSSVNTGGLYLNFTEAIFNENLPATTDNGYFTTINFSTITVSPNTFTLVAGETHQFTATGGIVPYIWTTSNNTIATIDATGLLTAHHSGLIQVTATDDVGASGTTGNITVYDTYIDIDNADAMVNSVYDLKVNILDFPIGQDIYSFNGIISFKIPELTALNIVPGPQNGGWSMVSNVSGNQISFAGAGTSPITSAGVLFKVRFQLTPDLTIGEAAYVNFVEINLNEGVPLPIATNGSITGTEGDQQQITLSSGYSFISSGIIPFYPDMLNVLSDNLDNLDFVRNTAGQMLRKIGPVWVNSIGNWITTEGYLFRMNSGDELIISGEPIDPQSPINLLYGYQLISYLPEQPINTADVFANVLDNLDFVRNTAGQMFRKIGPIWVNSIGDMQAGEGYLVKMNAEDVLIYPEATDNLIAYKTQKPEHYKVIEGNPYDPVWTIYFEHGPFNIGDEIGAYDGEILVGAGIVISDNILENSIPVFSNLYQNGNSPIFKVWNKSENEEYVISDYVFSNPYQDAWTEDVFPENDGEYSLLHFSITGILDKNPINPSFTIYPNPSKGISNISIEGVSGKVLMEVFDVHGNVHRFFEIEGISSTTTKQLDLKELPAGVYFINFSGNNFNQVKKIVIQ
jgi:hypothetical protein